MAAEDYPWLTQTAARLACKVAIGNADALERVEVARMAAADYCQDQRRDLFTTADPPVFEATPRVVQAATLATARLYDRHNNASGIVSFGEFAASILRRDPDVKALLGKRRLDKAGAG